MELNGALHFKVLTKISARHREVFHERDLLSGVMVPEDRYVDISLDDVYGRTWFAERLRPNHVLFGSGGDTVSGVLDNLTHTQTLPLTPSGASFTWWTAEPLKIPTNRDTDTRVSVARGKRKLGSSKQNVWSFRCVGSNFLIRPDTDGMLIEASDKVTLPPALFSSRVIETLQFVLGQPINWSVFQERTGNLLRTRLRSTELISSRVRFRPPISRTYVTEGSKESTKFHRRLFERYLRHTLISSDSQHHLWGLINTVSEVRSASYSDAHALVLGVTIEALLDREFPEVGAPDPVLATELEAVRDYVRAWQGNPSVKARLDGLTTNLKKIRAKDRLHALAATGAINRKHVRSWDRLRNAHAHEFQSGKVNPEEQMRLVQECTVLFYHLVYHAIGYRGKYTDYATPGWPLRTYPNDVASKDA